MDGITLTANSRLAITIRRDFDKAQQQRGLECWPSPNILPLTSWIEQTWQTLGCEQTLLTRTQLSQLWQKVLQQQPEAHALHISSSAEQLLQAWQMCQLWQIPINPFCEHDAATVLLHRCANEVADYCTEHAYISATQLPQLLIEQSQRWLDTLPTQVRLVGFDELSPTHQQLIDLISKHRQLDNMHNRLKPSSICRVECYDAQHELQVMANWAKQLQQQDPTQRIGCIVPNLEQLRNRIEKVFVETFASNHQHKPDSLIYNFSAGQKLTEFMLVEHALAILQLLTGTFTTNTLTALLQSPYLCVHDSDTDMGAMLDFECRKLNEVTLPLNALYLAFNKVQTHYPNSTWLSRWRSLCECAKQLSVSATSHYWAQQFIQTLQAVAWPGQRGLSSIEYQVLQRWRALLQEFSQLEPILGNLSATQALTLLRSLAATALFQPEGSDAPIQVLGLLESANLQFDHLWVMGLDSEHWPPKANPNPFIPHHIQRQYRLPHCNGERELQYSLNVQRRLLQSAKHITLSSAQHDGDKTLTASNLITHIALTPATASLLATTTEPIDIEILVDDSAPSIQPDEALHGGSDIIKLQALCPFRAYAELRLNAHAIEEATLNLAAFEKGNIVHRALQNIWLQVKSQQRLLELTEAQLEQLIDNASTHAIRTQQKALYSSAHQYFLETEKKRINQLLKDWLECEKQRPTFTVIERETVHQLTIKGLNIRCQVDRIDQSTDGQYIVDYKTGSNHIGSWFGERMREPQLPLYSSFIPDIDGVCFAEVRAAGLKFKGIVSETAGATFSELLPIDQVKHPDNIQDWQSQKRFWKQAIEQLLSNFCAGDARVDPLDTTLTCQYCQLQPLCRIASDE